MDNISMVVYDVHMSFDVHKKSIARTTKSLCTTSVSCFGHRVILSHEVRKMGN